MNLSFKVNKPIDTVFDYLTDMQKFASVHPVINKIDTIFGNNYLVHETLKLGFVPFSFTYSVTVDQNFIEKTVLIRATVMKLTKIEMRYALYADKQTTTISETIVFKSPFPVTFIMQQIFRKQHTLLFKNIEALK